MKVAIISRVALVTVGVFICATSALSIEITVGLIPEDSRIDNSTMFCGLVDVVNSGGDSIAIRPPLYVDRNLVWEVKHDGQLYEVQESSPVCRISQPPTVRLAPGERITIPFAIMRHGRQGFLFEDNGVYKVRAKIRIGRSEFVSEWVRLEVQDSYYAEQWREMFSFGDLVFAFAYPKTPNDMLLFLGTQGYSNWLLYLAGGYNTVVASESNRNMDSILDEDTLYSLDVVLERKTANSPSKRLWDYIRGPSDILDCKCYHAGDFVLRWL